MSGLPRAKGSMKTEGKNPIASLPRIVREMADRIVSRFDPEKIVLFGSHARGDAGTDSDVDLLVIMPVKGSRRHKMVEIGVALAGMGAPKDVIVATPDDLARYGKLPGTVLYSALREGIVLHERSA